MGIHKTLTMWKQKYEEGDECPNQETLQPQYLKTEENWSASAQWNEFEKVSYTVVTCHGVTAKSSKEGTEQG